MNSKAKLISVLAFSLASLALITTPAAMQQGSQQPAHNPQHQTQNPQAQVTPTPHPSPHPSPHPIAEPTVDPGPQPTPHPSPHPSPHPATDPSPVPGPVPAEVDMDRVKVKLPWPRPDAMMVDPQVIRTNKRPAIPFRPFELIDPKTNKPVPPDTLISPGEGRTMSVAEYYEEVNRVEKQLNQIGYSLRSPEAATIQLQDVILGNLQTQPGGDTELRRAQEGANKPAQNMSPEEIKKEATRLGVDAERETVLSSGNFGKPMPGERIATISKSLPWSYTCGDPRVFSTSLNGGIQLVGTPNGTGVTESVTATGTLFGNNVPVLMSVNNRLDAPLTGPMSATMSIMVFGQTVYSRNYTPTAFWSWQDTWASPIKYETPYVRIYANGPDFLDARFRVTGVVGVSFDNTLNRGLVSANVIPIVKTQVQLSAISWSVSGRNGGSGAEATGCPISSDPNSAPRGFLGGSGLDGFPGVISGLPNGAGCVGGPNGLGGVNPIVGGGQGGGLQPLNPVGSGSGFAGALGGGLRNEKLCNFASGGTPFCPTCDNGPRPADFVWNLLSNPLAEPNQNEIILLGMRQNLTALLALSSDNGGPYYREFYLAKNEVKALKGKLDASLWYDTPVPCPPGSRFGNFGGMSVGGALGGALGGLSLPIPCSRRVSLSVFNYNSPGVDIFPPRVEWYDSLKSYLNTNN